MKKKLIILSVFCFAFLFIGATCSYAGQADRESTAHMIVRNFAATQYEKVRVGFSDQMKTALPASKIGEAWENLLAKIGAFKTEISTSNTTAQGYNQTNIRCQFANGQCTVQVTFDSSDKVMGLYLVP